jgi:flagellar motor switch protein FliN/FliY
MSDDDRTPAPAPPGHAPGAAPAPAPAPASAPASAPAPSRGESFETLLGDVPLELTVELGRVSLSLRELAARLGPGSVIPLSKLSDERLDVRINDRLVARAEAVAVGERYGVRIVEIVRAEGGKP